MSHIIFLFLNASLLDSVQIRAESRMCSPSLVLQAFGMHSKVRSYRHVRWKGGSLRMPKVANCESDIYSDFKILYMCAKQHCKVCLFDEWFLKNAFFLRKPPRWIEGPSKGFDMFRCFDSTVPLMSPFHHHLCTILVVSYVPSPNGPHVIAQNTSQYDLPQFQVQLPFFPRLLRV